MARERHSTVATFLGPVSSDRHRHPKKTESGGRGTGVVMTTGSYEGSLATEGIPGSHEPSFFTDRWSRRPWRLSRRSGPRVSSSHSPSLRGQGEESARTTSTREDA